MDRRQFHEVVAMLAGELGFDAATPLIVQHTKARAVARVAGQHWHVVVPETNPATGEDLSSRFDHARHEKVARQVEILLGHPVIAGAHDLAVLAARVRQLLSVLEADARAKIATTGVPRGAAQSSRLHTARRYRDATHSRHAEALGVCRAAQELLASAPTLHRSLADRLLGRQPTNPDLAVLERAVDIARDELIAAEYGAAGADGHLATVEKAESAERVQCMGEMEAQRKAAMAALGEIVMAQKMVRAYPRFVYCGPAFVAWSSGKVERKREGPRNPWAVNQWGIPLDFG